MESMISKDNVRVVELLETQAIEFVRSPVDEETRSKDRRSPPPPKPQQIQRPRAGVQNIANRATAVAGNLTAFEVTSLLSEGASTGGGIGIAQSLIAGSMDSIDLMSADDLIPMTMLPPQYPPSALLRKIEGWVELVFTVTEEGAVVNPEVSAAYPEGEFERAAIAAARRWRFRPVVRDGAATKITAQIRMDFTLASNR